MNITLVALVASFIAWSAMAHVDVVTKGEGRIVPSRNIQLVQNLEGGIVEEILVRDGAVVKKGQVLIRIDATGAGSDLGEQIEKISGLEARLARLVAETEGKALIFPDALLNSHQRLINQERKQYNSRQLEIKSALSVIVEQAVQRRQQISETNAKIKSVAKSLEIVRQELSMTEPLVAQGAASRIEVIRLEARIAELEGELDVLKLSVPRLQSAIRETTGQLIQKKENYRTEALDELNRVTVELSAMTHGSEAQRDRVARTEVRSPVNGIVKRIHVSTEGQVLRPGMDIAEVVPLDDSLLVEAKIRPVILHSLSRDSERCENYGL